MLETGFFKLCLVWIMCSLVGVVGGMGCFLGDGC